MSGISFIAHGFSPEDFRSIELSLAEKGFSLEAADGPAEAALRRTSSPIVLFCLKSESDLSLLKTLKANFPDKHFAVAVEGAQRDLLGKALLMADQRAFLLPLDPSELKRLAGQMFERLKELDANLLLFCGLNSLDEKFVWETRSILISQVSRHLTQRMVSLGFYKTRAEADQAVLSFEEALVNSVEHGNLELDSSLKPGTLLEKDRFEELREERMADPHYGGRELRVTLSYRNREARVVISDQGPGFDISQLRRPTEENASDASGKGFHLINRSFDYAYYNDDGSELTLIKKRS
jgi:hypothetical protein